MKKIIGIILILILIVISSLIYIYNKPKDNVLEYETSAIENKNNNVNLDEERIKYNNNDIIGRLEIPELFNILIVKGSDNKYYLNHSIGKTYDIRGSEFMDYRVDKNSKQINIYGHNSRTFNLPFRLLENFKNTEFFNNNEYLYFQTDEELFKYKILAFKEEKDTFEHMYVNKVGEEFINHLDILKSNAFNYRDIKYDEDSEIITLQTCYYNKSDSYLVLTAIKEK